MKFNKLYILFAFAFMISSASFGQLLERENVDRKIATGTRPVEGNMGYFIGPSIAELDEILDDELDIRGFPLMGFKYYFRDNIEFRLSTQLYGTTEKQQGTLVNTIGQEDNVTKETFMRFMPGAYYHFSSSNFLDTYMGASFIIGTEIDEVVSTEKTSLTGDFFSEQYRKQTLDWGFNFTYGLQAFVADLPIALAVEASIRGLKKTKLEYEATTRSSVGGVVTEQTFFSTDVPSGSGSALQFEELEYSKYEYGADLRFMITYYFRK